MVYIGEYPKNPNTQGWEQFNASKSAMLSAFDQAIVRSKGRKVQTEHGRVAEAEFRKWLSDFLPKKYGVTSGFIISQGLGGCDDP